MPPEIKQEYRIQFHDVDFTGKLKVYALFNYLQQTANTHANNLEVGYHHLRKKKLFWVLSRIIIRIEQYPGWEEKITIESWPKKIDKIFSIRDYIIYNSKKNKIITATTAWLLLEQETMRIRMPGELNIAYTARHGLELSPKKLHPKDKTEPVCRRQVAYNDMDMNLHVNNAKYIEWITDIFDHTHYRDHRIKQIQVNFLSEAKSGHIVELSKNSSEKGISFIEAVELEKQKPVFKARLEWEPVIR